LVTKYLEEDDTPIEKVYEEKQQVKLLLNATRRLETIFRSGPRYSSQL
jgi:hypothetical protein